MHSFNSTLPVQKHCNIALNVMKCIFDKTNDYRGPSAQGKQENTTETVETACAVLKYLIL